MTYLDILRIQLRIDEGEVQFPYQDTRGFLTIGIGRNLTVKGINAEERKLIFENDLSEAVAVARRCIPSFDALNDVRKYVVVNMAFNMGYGNGKNRGLSSFVNTLKAIAGEQWETAAILMAQSDWAKQVGARAVRLATNMRTGVWYAQG